MSNALRDNRVEEVAQLMREGKFLPSATRVKMITWSINSKTMSEYVQEAARVVAKEMLDGDFVRVAIATTLLASLDYAQETKRFGHVATVSRELAELAGIQAAKTQIAVTVKHDDQSEAAVASRLVTILTQGEAVSDTQKALPKGTRNN